MTLPWAAAKLLPWRAIVSGALALIVVSAFVLQSRKIDALRAELNEFSRLLDAERLARSVETAQRASVAASAVQAYREREAATTAAHAANLEKMKSELKISEAARARSDDSVARMRRAITLADATRRGPAAADPAAPAGSAPATAAELVPAGLYYWADERARELAEELGAARRAGFLCERNYDALTTSQEERQSAFP